MKDINLSIYDIVVDHLADGRRYEESIKVNIARAVRRHQTRLKSILSSNLNNDIRGEVTRSSVELHSILDSAVKDYSEAAISFYTNLVDKNVGKFYAVQRPPFNSAYLTEIGPNGSKYSLRNSFDAIGTRHYTRINNIISNGVAAGKSKNQIINEVIKSTGVPEAQAKTIVRTAITNVQNNAVLAVVEDNKEVFKYYRFTAVLDNRTSAICSSNDGKTFPIDKVELRPPLHFNCRSSLVPIVKSKEEILKLDSARIRKDKLEDIKNLSGEIPAVENFSGWLKRQTMDIQLKYLGTEEKVGLFQQGALELNSFITNTGNRIGIEVLRKLDNARTFFFRTRQIDSESLVETMPITRPYDLTRSEVARRQLKELLINDAVEGKQALSLVDYRGTTLAGKRVSRMRSNNEFDERNNSFDPFTGEQRSTLLYDPDFTVYQERLDFLNASKTLTADQKVWIRNFVEELEDQVSVNQQTAIVENLRILFERYNKDKKLWDNFNNVLRAEMQYSVVNTSRVLDRRSRAASQQFESYGLPGEPAKVQIGGRYYAFNDIIDKTLEYQRDIQSWAAKEATPISMSIYYRGRSPLYTYFQGPIGRDTLEKQFKAKLEKAVRSIPGGKLFLDREKPTESMMVQFIRERRESLRRIIDLEFLFNKNKKNYLDELIIEEIGGKQAINALNKIVTQVASGQSTDYDTLAINIGKTLRKEWKLTEKHVFPFWKPTLADYHADGSKILTALRDQGHIRVISRGVTRRSVIDLDTGRASGPWKDTVSREVQILNPKMLELQSKNRAVLLSRRIGIVNDRDRLYVRPGQKNYFDARGRDTGIPIVTRRANANYDQDLVDRDFADMLNHTMSVKYEVDQEFSEFMEEIVRFRDPRGNVKKYDDLNDFRKLIITRGDQGYSLMQTIKFHRENKRPFSVVANIDGRGRVYYQGFLTPTGGTVARPFMNSAKSYAMNVDSLKELVSQIGVMVADTTEGLSNTGRAAAFARNERLVRELGEIILSKTQRDRRIREFLEHPLVRATDPEEIAQLARLSTEYTRIFRHVDGDFNNVAKLATYRTKLLVDNDASASGAQMIALATRDKLLAKNSNVVPTTQKNRLYDLVAMDTVADPEFQKIRTLVDAGITWEDLQKAAKSANMVQLYGRYVPYQNSVNSVELLIEDNTEPS